MDRKPEALYKRFPQSEACDCDICQYFCHRPGWWIVSEAREAIMCGFADRMMLEFSPDFTFAVLSPAFKGNEANFALSDFADNECTFLENGHCVIFQESFRPLECRFCHHDRLGLGKQCHSVIEQDWNTGKGKRLVKQWAAIHDLPLFQYIAK